MSISALHQNLIRRYLLWAYKTTRESFERLERKTTQLKVDEYILKALKRSSKNKDRNYQKFMDEFNQYIVTKKKDELDQKFVNDRKEKFNPQYLYLKNRLSAIEEAICYFLGKKELGRIEKLYEEEFTQRILQAKEH